MPSLEEFFEDAIEQADPVNMVEDEYKYALFKTCIYIFLQSNSVSPE